MASDGFVDIARRKLIQLFVVPENDNRDIDRTEDGKLIRLLEETAFAFEEGSDTIKNQYMIGSVVWRWCGGGVRALGQHLHRTVSVVLDGLDLDFSTTHRRVSSSRCARVLSSFASKVNGVSALGQIGQPPRKDSKIDDRWSRVVCKAGRSLCLKQDPDSNRCTVFFQVGLW